MRSRAIWLVAGVVLAAVVADARQPPIGIIVGRVVDAASGHPVPEAEVTVSVRAGAAPAAGVPGGMAGASPTSVRLLTGADGRFVVRDLIAGNVQLNAKATGYVAGAYGQARPSGPSTPVVITNDNRIVAATIRLWRHAAVSGTITDERGEPAVNVMVFAMARTYRNGQPRFGLTRPGRTDDRGMYRVSGLAPGDYIVALPQTQSTMPVSAMDEAMQGVFGGQALAASAELMAGLGAGAGNPGFGVRVGDQLVSAQSGAMPVLTGDGRMSAYATQFYPAAATLAEAGVFSLAPGEERTGIDMRMSLVPTSRISGTVMGPDGPLPNVQMRLMHSAETDGDIFTDVARSMTSANGAFQMFGVPAGQYLLKVVRPGRQPLPAAVANNPQLAALMGGRGGPVSPSDALTLFADVPLTVDKDIADLAIVTSTGATVSGRVEFVGTSVVPPFTGMTVALTPLGTQTVGLRSVTVGEDGRFTIPGAMTGKYFITASGRSPGWLPKSAMVNGIDALDQPFELSLENIGNVVITFTDRQSTVTGTVTDGSGAPAQGTVLIFPAAHKEWISRGMPSRLTRNVRAQAKGAFSLPNLPARDYLILAIADDALPDLQNPSVYEALARAAVTISLAEGDTRTLSLKLSQVVR